MSAAPSSFLMLRVPLIISGIIYLAIAWIVPSLGFFERADTFEIQFQVLAVVLGVTAIVLGCTCHIQSSTVFWIVFVTTLFYVPSVFFFLGIPMLVFLLRKEVQDYYGVCLTRPKPGDEQ